MRHGEDWAPGSIVEMYGEKYRIKKNWGSSGGVEYLDGLYATMKFYWTYQGDKAKLISRPDESK